MKKKYLAFMPKTDGSKKSWLNNAYEKADTACPQLGLLPAEITEFKDALQSSTDTLDNATVKRAELDQALYAKEMLKENEDKVIRRLIARMKSSSAFNLAVAAELGIVANAVAIDDTAVKPVLKIKLVAGMVRISFSKQYMSNICLFSRQRNTQNWVKIAQTNRSPFTDTRSLAEAGTPEAREYMALFNDGTTEIGQESEIYSILTGTQASNI
jgi:hypothetical protein